MRVLIVGSLEGHVTTAAKIALNKGAKVTQTLTVLEALETLRSGKGSDLILIDLKLGVEQLVKSLEKERIFVPVVACGISCDAKEAAGAIRAGAKEYLSLPPDPELIAAVIGAFAQPESAVICHDPKMANLLRLADKVAPSEANILITGESGTGKEVMATYIHNKSRRADKPFVSLNCAAIPDNLLESELFGHEKGAFTGAVARRIGKFEEADGGTLLLDEISEMHPRLQAKLLRAIQEKIIDRVGGTQPIKVNIRIIATSNRDLLQAAKRGDFREDLYFRLNVINVHLPSLAERPSDIIPLAQYFCKKYSEFNNVPVLTLSDPAMAALQKNPWQGNVRELENTIHRAVLLCSSGVIEVEDLFGLSVAENEQNDATPPVPANPFVGRSMSDVEKELILGTLDHCYGNRTHAATILGISIRTLRNKLKEYVGLDVAV
ncbi:MAG: sigma-54 dependent transcriptional regulator [Alphaproteobacteria bacterium]|nr:sigma-54 dependent transcriptional regulator [Alphaproteobacteria bacterium]